MKLRFKNVPILYLPYITFPISDARKSGILTPEIGSSGRSGNQIRVPYYWNIAPNYDATITPRLLTKRGLQLGTEFRYLTPSSEGQLELDYLHNDREVDLERYRFAVQHRTSFADRWRLLTNLEEISDPGYFEDIGINQNLASQTHLNRFVDINYQAPY